jgi:adenylate cyclase
MTLNDANLSVQFPPPATFGWLTLNEWKTEENAQAGRLGHGVLTPVRQRRSLAIVGAIARPRRDRLMTETAALALEAASAPFTRRLLTILAADVVGYARLTEVAEDETHQRLRSLRVGIIDPCVVSYRGRIVKNTGDGFLAAFDSSLDAVRCAVELQHEIATAERPEAPDRKIAFRMGVNVGATIVESEDIYGLGVNVAARLEQIAPAGGIVASAEVIELIKPGLDIPVDDLGALRLKNMSRPVHAFSLRIPGAGRVAAAATKRTRPTRRAKVPSVAVLPFRNAGGGADDSYFGDGMVEDIIVALQSIRGLLVIARTSTLSYRDGTVDVQKVGQDLGVRYVLSGSVRRTGTQLRIVSELSDVESGSVIWADSYDGNIEELFDFQARIATRIVWSVAPHVREAELKRALRKRPDNMNAYDLVMQAIDLMYRMNFEDFTKAGALLQQAIVADENYPTAYAYAALWHIHHVVQGWGSDTGPDRAEAARLAAAAVERDPADGFALAIYAHTKSILFRDYSQAVGIFDRALDASPGNAMAWSLSSGVYSYMGDGRAAVERAQQGLRLSPVDTQAFFYLAFLGFAHYVNGAYDEAIIWTRKSMSLNPRLCATLRALIASLVARGDFDEARRIGQALLDVQPRFRIASYAKICPFRGDVGEKLLARLRTAGLPE